MLQSLFYLRLGLANEIQKVNQCIFYFLETQANLEFPTPSQFQ